MNWSFTPAQEKMVKCHERELLVSGPVRCGKSLPALRKAYLIASKYPDARILLLRKTRASCTQSILVTLESEVIPIEDSCRHAGGDKRNRQSYQLENGSEIVVAGLDRPEKVLSSEYDLIIVDEAVEITADEYQFLLTRLSHTATGYQQIMCLTNPSHSKHWLYLKAMAGNMAFIETTHKDNPKIFNQETQEFTEWGKTYIDSLERSLQGVRKERLLYGKWMSLAASAAFPNWSQKNIIDIKDLPQIERYIGGLDFGFSDNGVIEVIGQAKEGATYIVHEVIRKHQTINWWVDKVKQVQERFGSMKWICDSASPSSIQVLKDAGINAIPCKKGPGSIPYGVDLINQRIEKNKFFYVAGACGEIDLELKESGKPCTFAEEAEFYEHKKDKNGNITEDFIDADNHSVDCNRYIISYLDGGVKPMSKPFLFGKPRDIPQQIYNMV